LKFSDVIMAVTSAAVILVLIMFPMDIVLVPALGFFWGINVGGVISVLLTALIVGYIFAEKILESRMESITKITVLSAVLFGFFVAIEAAATDYSAMVKEAYSWASHTAFEWHVVEALSLSGQIFFNVVIVLVLGFIGLYVGSRLPMTLS